MHYHLVARVFGKQVPLSDPRKALWLWTHLKGVFPNTLAAVLMPNHLHLILETDQPSKNRLTLSRLLGQFTTLFQTERPFWQPVPESLPLIGTEKLLRNVRYTLLNPCRARLCADPLEWTWSTYRGSIGAVENPWVSPHTLLSLFSGRPLAQIHRYITSDPSVHVQGSALPCPAPVTQSPNKSLDEIARAAFAAAEALPDPSHFRTRMSLTRTLFIRLAIHQGWSNRETLARYMGIHRSVVRYLTIQEQGKASTAAALCLGDARLLTQRFVSHSAEQVGQQSR